MEKLSVCRICMVENARMCVVTNKSLLDMFKKLTDVPFVAEDSKPMLACSFCCTRLKQCCKLQRQCVQAQELLTQMLSEDYKQKPLTNRGHLEFAGGFIITPIETMSIGADGQMGGDALKQELPAVCEEQDDAELQLAHLSKEFGPENLYYRHPNVEAHHSESASEDQCLMEIKIEVEEELDLSENLRDAEPMMIKLENPDERYPGVEDIPAHDSESDTEDDVPLMEIKTEVEEVLEVSKRKKRACVTRRAAVAKKPTLKRKLEDTIPAKQAMNVLSESTTMTGTPVSVDKIKEPITPTSQSSFTQSSNLLQYTRTHTGEKPFKCDLCQRGFSNKSNLNKHFQIHTGEKRYQCDVCQRRFSLRSTLELHNRIHTGEKPYQCNVCQRSFICKSNLNVHYRKHTGEKPFKCDVCQRHFSSKSTLNVHFRKHSGEKPFQCDVCLRKFISQSNLKVHFRIHSGEKPFKCDVCQHNFSFKSHLKDHLRKHSGEKPYKCDVCLRSFTQSAHLKQHSRVHTGEKPYKCEVCQESFNLKNSLNVHFRKHSGKDPFKCDVCQRSLSCKRNLDAHLRIHSGP